jgi:hypothetical protein
VVVGLAQQRNQSHTPQQAVVLEAVAGTTITRVLLVLLDRGLVAAQALLVEVIPVLEAAVRPLLGHHQQQTLAMVEMAVQAQTGSLLAHSTQAVVAVVEMAGRLELAVLEVVVMAVQPQSGQTERQTQVEAVAVLGLIAQALPISEEMVVLELL